MESHRGDSGAQFPPTAVHSRSGAPRVLVVAILAAFVAFVVGLELGGPRLPAVARGTPVDVAPSIDLSPAVISAITPAGPPSHFAEAFAPKLLLDGLPGGSVCVTQTAGFNGSGESPSAPLLARVWLTSCPIPVAARRAFLDALVASLEVAIPSNAHNTEADARGMSIEEFPYIAEGSPSTVIVAADTSRSSLLLSFTLEEHVRPASSWNGPAAGSGIVFTLLTHSQ